MKKEFITQLTKLMEDNGYELISLDEEHNLNLADAICRGASSGVVHVTAKPKEDDHAK